MLEKETKRLEALIEKKTKNLRLLELLLQRRAKEAQRRQKRDEEKLRSQRLAQRAKQNEEVKQRRSREPPRTDKEIPGIDSGKPEAGSYKTSQSARQMPLNNLTEDGAQSQEPSLADTEVNEDQSAPETGQPLGPRGWKKAPKYEAEPIPQKSRSESTDVKKQEWRGSKYQGQPRQKEQNPRGKQTLRTTQAQRIPQEPHERVTSSGDLHESQQFRDLERPQDTPTSKTPKKHRSKKQRELDAEQQVDDGDIYDDELSSDMKQRNNQKGKAIKSRESRKRRDDVDDDFDPDEYRAQREQRKQMKKAKARQKELENQGPSPLYLPAFISVSNLADVIGIRHAQFVHHLEEMGFEDVTHNHILDAETAGLVATEFNFEPIFDVPDEDLVPAPKPEDKSTLPSRPPVVTIMGHVDHGKTTILDWLRHSSVAASEHGGITQHIGAFSVAMPSGKTITFLDTPGHEAFLDMRRRGADVTDIVVLVVAADDSVKPQTIEAIKHATSSRVPVIVAMSKIDKPGINTEKVKQDLSVQNIHVEDYGGDVQAIGVSGKTGQGMLELEEAIITLSEVLDHRADDTGNVEGWVIEASTKSYGRVATTLVRRGTLRAGDVVVAGTTWARVRTLRNEAGATVDEATPGMPVEIDGWREQPVAGSEFLQAPDEQTAKDVVELRQEKSETERLGADTAAMNKARRETVDKRRLEQAGEDIDGEQGHSGPKKINFIIKADVGGSAEAVMNSVAAIGNNEVYANVLRSAVGQVSESDIEHTASANGHLICFNQPIDPAMAQMAEKRGVPIIDHNVIYKLVDEVKGVLGEHLSPSVTQRVTGEAEISQIFEINVKRRESVPIAGCKVRNGVINRARKVRVLRGQDVVYDGKFLFATNLLEKAITDKSRHHLFPEEHQERCDRNAQRHRVWYGLRGLD